MSRNILGITLLASLVLVLSIFFVYRGANWPLGTQSIEAGGAFLLLMLINGAFFWYSRRKVWFSGAFVTRSIALGLGVGLLWTAEISMNNLLTPALPLRDILDDLFWGLIALIILGASIRQAYRANTIRAGINAGLWSGLGSGAVACLTALLFVVAGMSWLLHDPLNRAEWSVRSLTGEAPNMAVYFAYQTLAGALLHLVLLGAIMGMLLGLFGGILARIGSALRQRWLQSGT